MVRFESRRTQKYRQVWIDPRWGALNTSIYRECVRKYSLSRGNSRMRGCRGLIRNLFGEPFHSNPIFKISNSLPRSSHNNRHEAPLNKSSGREFFSSIWQTDFLFHVSVKKWTSTEFVVDFDVRGRKIGKGLIWLELHNRGRFDGNLIWRGTVQTDNTQTRTDSRSCSTQLGLRSNENKRLWETFLQNRIKAPCCFYRGLKETLL